MAETIVSAVIGDAVSRVISLLTGRFSHQQSTEAKLRRICHMLVRIHSAVEEAKARQIINDGVLQWLSELIDGEYQGRYLLDMISCGDRKELDEDKDSYAKQVPLPQPQASSMSLFNPAKRMRVAAGAMKKVLSRCDLIGAADEVDRVLESLQGVSGDLGEFILLLQGFNPIGRPLPTNIFIDGQMFGRHVEKQRIINFLLHNNEGRSPGGLDVLPIVGAIGVGKTTLVQHSCDDDRVRRHFSVIMFFNFSCTYAIAATRETGTAVAIRSKHVIGDAQLSLNDPLQWIKRHCHDKRFLVVFEGVDMCRKQKLQELLLKLRCAEQGSKVIFTTNNRRVSTLGTVEPIVLKVLPIPEYWFFFKAHAFAGRDLEENPRLVRAGKAIARKLNGSFFGAKIVGGLLKDHPDPRFWFKVLRSNIGGLSMLGDGMGYIADLSENLLPNHVNVCQVNISKVPFASQIELPRFQDLCEPRASETSLADNVSFARVLLCKSVMPFYNNYYIASCTIGSGNICCERTMVSSSFLLDDL
ncbi:hypothetical protein SEVIR_3G322700v4 [Setaria viridis]|uniref:NB-ARC domain-containing protein n=1 Tax=Setaria viridis TaxID=4556 RepID=A0A4U6VKU5_SETVI|nr:disease resistance protein RGA2-like [Setaria viridis]TKW28199.1 hypothetical protein SEVIR_3G322700v2 [Setaria viridis]